MARPTTKGAIRRRPAVGFGLVTLVLAGCAQPELKEFRMENYQSEISELRKRDVKLAEALTLEAALKLALENNFEYALAQLQRDIQYEAATGESFAMLPSLNTEVEFASSDKRRISSSENAVTGATSLVPSFSTEKSRTTANIEFLWGVLDFGIAYFRARQAENQALITDEQVRRTRQNLAVDVANTYYRAVVADLAVGNSKALLAKLQERQKVVERQVKEGTLSAAKGLENEEQLVMTQIRLQDFQRELRQAKTQLSSQLGLSPDCDIRFAKHDFTKGGARQAFDLKALEEEALKNRPEMFQEDLRQLISVDEIHVAITNFFPSPAGFLRADSDSNKFLKHNEWLTAGARVSWDLLGFPQKISNLNRAEMGEAYSKERRLSVAVGIVTQTHLSVIAYDDSHEQYELAKNLVGVRDRQLADVKKRQGAGMADEGEVLMAESEKMFADLRHMNAFSLLKVSWMRVSNAVGREPEFQK